MSVDREPSIVLEAYDPVRLTESLSRYRINGVSADQFAAMPMPCRDDFAYQMRPGQFETDLANYAKMEHYFVAHEVVPVQSMQLASRKYAFAMQEFLGFFKERAENNINPSQYLAGANLISKLAVDREQLQPGEVVRLARLLDEFQKTGVPMQKETTNVQSFFHDSAEMFCLVQSF